MLMVAKIQYKVGKIICLEMNLGDVAAGRRIYFTISHGHKQWMELRRYSVLSK